MSKQKLCVGVVGAGAISDIYLKNMITQFDNLTVKSVCAGHIESAQKKAELYGITAVTMEEMLDDPEIDIVVNLTPAHAHYGVIKAALEHGKHVYTEKTMTDVLTAMLEGGSKGKFTDIMSTCTRPEPLPKANLVSKSIS